MTYKEAADRIEEHLQIHFKNEYQHAYKITEALEMAVKILRVSELASKATLCKLRAEDKCDEWCDGWCYYESCYVPSEVINYENV